jgi:hypothetical protein
MEFVQNSDSLQAAAVRMMFSGQPKPGDAERLEAHFTEVFAGQEPDGHLEQQHHSGARATSEKLLGLLDLGCSPGRPEVQRALEAVEKAIAEVPEDEAVGCRELTALLMTGRAEHPTIKSSLERLAKSTVEGLGEGDPGTPMAQLMALWLGRELADVDDAIETILQWLENAVEPPGCSKQLGLCEPWGLVDMVGLVGHPAAARIARTLVPMLLRSQEPDGGWGERWWIGGEKHSTIYAFKALREHGLLDELRDLPPLPPDWEVVRAIPAPCEKPRNITCGDDKLWVLDGAEWAAIAVSPDDGAVLETVVLPKKPRMSGFGFAASDGVFYLTAHGEEGTARTHVFEVDMASGEVRRELFVRGSTDGLGCAKVGESLLVADGWMGGVWVVDLQDPEAESRLIRVAASMPDYLASHGEEVWGVDWFSPSLVKTNTEGDLLDWGEQPFGFNAIAFDGEHLWALDAENNRICLIERADARKGAAQ